MNKGRHFLALFLALSLLLTACGNIGGNTAATMRLVKTEGTVSVDDARGKEVQPIENLGLFSGYALATQAESYGWISLDDTKLAKMDARSQVDITKEDRLLELNVRSGNLFFNVTEPLAEDEAMNIRTSTMTVGIRGTCGWVEVEDENLMCVYLLRGKVECTVLDEDGGVLASETITAGQAALMRREDGEASITVAEFDIRKAPAFMADELDSVEGLDFPDSSEESIQPEETDQPEDDDGAEALLAPYAGTYTLYESFEGDGGKLSLTLGADGTVTGGFIRGLNPVYVQNGNSVSNSPVSVVPNADGSITISFSDVETYTVYPPGTVVPDIFDSFGIDPTAVNLDYLYTSGGVLRVIYRSDFAFQGEPASTEEPGQLGEPQTPVQSDVPAGEAISALPAQYTGEYVADDTFYFPVTFSEDGKCMGAGDYSSYGAYNHYAGEPASILQFEDGTVEVRFSDQPFGNFVYTFYPEGIVPADYTGDEHPGVSYLKYWQEGDMTIMSSDVVWYYK